MISTDSAPGNALPVVTLAVALALTLPAALAGAAHTPIRFNTSVEGAALGKIERLNEAEFRCHVPGQQDEHGRNRQANWYYFRMDDVQGREITLTLTDFVGEYNGRPGACPMNAQTIPVFSYDDEQWQHFPEMRWDADKKEATLRFRPEQNQIWIAHVPPYTWSRLNRLFAQLDRQAWVRREVIGQTVHGRTLHLVTVTDFTVPDTGKKTVWLQARQHAWEAPTSWVMEGALRFVTSDDARARELRTRIVFRFIPMMDPDGCATGKVRFNANGYDVNRHWDEVDLRAKTFLEAMPEIWYAKKAILSCMGSAQPIALMLNLHNTETAEYLETHVTDETLLGMMRKLFDTLAQQTSFDPSSPLRVTPNPGSTTNYLWNEHRVPVLLMEQRISPSPKLGRPLGVADRLRFGQELIRAMAGAVLP